MTSNCPPSGAGTGGLPGEVGFEEEALAFLSAHAPVRGEETHAFGEGSDEVGLFPERTRDEVKRELDEAREWSARVFDAGFGWLAGPVEYGGGGLPPSYDRLYKSLEARFETPSRAPLLVGLGMVAPTILAHGTEAAKRTYLRALHRGDAVGCQLFSEPSNGSDLAGVSTTAVRDGDEWILNGAKVWTSGAQFSHVGEILCRTDPTAPKHRGLSAFLVDMHAPGVEVRPLRQMTGGASFNEVFLSDVRVAPEFLLGDVNGGWQVALTTLMNERLALGAGVSGGGTILERLRHLIVQLGRADDPLVRQAFADVYIRAQVARQTAERAAAKLGAGELPGAELAIGKLSLTETMRRSSELAARVLGPRICADSGEWGTYAWAQYLLAVPGMRIAGGTDEILRNVVAERVLGLPREPAPKK